MIVFSVRVVVPAAKRSELLKLLGPLLAPTRVQPGCVGARLYADTDDVNAFTLVEEWESQAEFDRYLASDARKTVVATMELSAVPPEVKLDVVEQRTGIEAIAKG